MKKTLLPLILIVLLNFAKAQNAIPNPGFENWHPLGAYQDPDGWNTLNPLTYILGVVSAERDTVPANVHSGNSALKLSNRIVPISGYIPGMASTGTINQNTQAIEGGTPFTLRPSVLTGWYKGTTVRDTFLAEITIWKWDTANNERKQIGYGKFINTSSVSSYTQFTMLIDYLWQDTPDSAVITLSSGTLYGPIDNSEFYVDDLSFANCSGFYVIGASTSPNCGDSTGTAFTTPVGGVPPYNYLWSGGETTDTIWGLAAGDYDLTVTDSIGCPTYTTITVTGLGCPLSVTIDSFQVYTCWPQGIPVIPTFVRATAAGGTPPYTYAWTSTGDSLDCYNCLSTVAYITHASTYTVVVTDSNNNTASFTYVVSDPCPLQVTLDSNQTVCNVTGFGRLNPNVRGGTPPYTYAWTSTGDSLDCYNCGNPGTLLTQNSSYTVVVTDSNSNTATATTNFIFGQCADSCFALFFMFTDSSNTGVYYGFNVSYGSSPDYLWDFGDGTTDTLPYPIHNYAVPATYNICLTITTDSCTDTYCDSSFYVFKTEGGLISQLIIQAPNAIKKVVQETKIGLYPNPANSELFIETNKQQVEQVNIYNTIGSLVNQTKLPLNNRMDISQLPAGAYIAEIKVKAATTKLRWVKM